MPLPRNPISATPPLTDPEIDAVLRELDKLTTPSKFIARREHARMPYREPVAVVCEAVNRPGHMVRFTAICHDLSDGGLGVLSPVPLAPGTLAVFTLVTAAGDEHPVTATLAACDQVRDNVYKCGAKFDFSIDVAAFSVIYKAG